MIEIKIVTLCRKCETMYEGNLLSQKCQNCGYKLDLAATSSGILEALEDED